MYILLYTTIKFSRMKCTTWFDIVQTSDKIVNDNNMVVKYELPVYINSKPRFQKT